MHLLTSIYFSQTTTDTAEGGRKGADDQAVSAPSGNQVSAPPPAQQATAQAQPSGLTKEEVEAMAGSLKIHVKLNLELDIQVVAKLKGDIVIGIL